MTCGSRALPAACTRRLPTSSIAHGHTPAHTHPTAPPQVKHYAARADAGLLITEATLVAPEGRGVPNTPGVWTPEQAAGWKTVTDAVHARGGRIFCQLWHQGRTAVAALNGGVTPVGPSAVAFTDGMGAPAPAPRALETAEVAGVIAQYRRGAELALEAGFDGVELHAANGALAAKAAWWGRHARVGERAPQATAYVPHDSRPRSLHVHP
jgi:N-ethylmaleimide reductase